MGVQGPSRQEAFFSRPEGCDPLPTRLPGLLPPACGRGLTVSALCPRDCDFRRAPGQCLHPGPVPSRGPLHRAARPRGPGGVPPSTAVCTRPLPLASLGGGSCSRLCPPSRLFLHLGAATAVRIISHVPFLEAPACPWAQFESHTPRAPWLRTSTPCSSSVAPAPGFHVPASAPLLSDGRGSPVHTSGGPAGPLFWAPGPPQPVERECVLFPVCVLGLRHLPLWGEGLGTTR